MDLNNINLLDLQTNYMKQDKTTQAICYALNKQFRKLSQEIKSVSIYSRLNELFEPLIDELAWQMHVDFYDYSLSLDKKVELIKNSLRLHKIKGTPAAVEEAASTVFGRTKLEEWFEYGGEPFFFRVNVEVTEQGASPENLKKLDLLINEYKNKRSWLEKVNIFMTLKCKMYFASCMNTGEEIIVYPWSPKNVQSKGNVNIAIAQSPGVESMTIYPKNIYPKKEII